LLADRCTSFSTCNTFGNRNVQVIRHIGTTLTTAANPWSAHLEQKVDTTTPTRKLLLQITRAFAEFEQAARARPPQAPQGQIASEMASTKADVNWVILSACNPAAGGPTSAEATLSSLARAYIYAQARALLVSR